MIDQGFTSLMDVVFYGEQNCTQPRRLGHRQRGATGERRTPIGYSFFAIKSFFCYRNSASRNGA